MSNFFHNKIYKNNHYLEILSTMIFHPSSPLGGGFGAFVAYVVYLVLTVWDRGRGIYRAT